MKEQQTICVSKETGICIFLAILSFFGFFAECIQALIECKTYGLDVVQFTQEQYLMHWKILIPIWFIISVVVVYLSRKNCHYDVFASYSVPHKWQIICGIAIPILFVIIWSCFNEGPGFYKFYKNFPFKMFVYQYVYYVFEMLLAGLIICLSQIAIDNICEKATNIPWGGLILGLSWGLLHYFTKGSALIAIFSFVIAILFGVVFNWVGKDLKKAWPLMYLVFVSIG